MRASSRPRSYQTAPPCVAKEGSREGANGLKLERIAVGLQYGPCEAREEAKAGVTRDRAGVHTRGSRPFDSLNAIFNG